MTIEQMNIIANVLKKHTPNFKFCAQHDIIYFDCPRDALTKEDLEFLEK